MIYNLLFLLIWVAIITLAKDKIITKIKRFFKIPITDNNIITNNNDLIKNIKREYYELTSTLSIDCLSIKDDLYSSNQVTPIDPNITIDIKKDILEDKEYFIDEKPDKINLFQIFKKTFDLLKTLFYDLFIKIKSYLF